MAAVFRPASGPGVAAGKLSADGGGFGARADALIPVAKDSSREHGQKQQKQQHSPRPGVLPLSMRQGPLRPRRRGLRLRDTLTLALLFALPFLASRLPDPQQHRLLFLYYQPMVPPLALLWLWSVAVGTFHSLHISYEDCFPPSQRELLLSAPQVRDLAAHLTSLVAASACAFCTGAITGVTSIASMAPPALYLALLGLLLLPLRGALHGPSRLFFARNLAKLAVPIRPMGWADFLLADFLTSLSKPISDMERAVCHMATAPVLEPLTVASGGRASGACSNASPIIPLFLAAPYLWRLGQCIRCYVDTRSPSHLANAAKYATALPVIFLSHLSYHVPRHAWLSTWQPAWMAASLLNTCFSIYWDTERDWTVPWLLSGRWLPSPSAKAPRMYGRPVTYGVAMVLNAALRVSWTHKLSSHLRHYRVVGLLVCLGEVLRRFQWCFFRIETELLKMQEAADRAGSSSLEALLPMSAGSLDNSKSSVSSNNLQQGTAIGRMHHRLHIEPMTP